LGLNHHRSRYATVDRKLHPLEQFLVGHDNVVPRRQYPVDSLHHEGMGKTHGLVLRAGGHRLNGVSDWYRQNEQRLSEGAQFHRICLGLPLSWQASEHPIGSMR
jgi:hypothetical protein